MNATLDNLTFETADVAELVLAAQAGDRGAYGELVHRFQGMVYALAMRRLHDHAEAQELTQEVLVKAYEKLYQLHAPEAWAGWLRSITTRMAINRCVRRAPVVAAEPLMLEATCMTSRTPVDDALESERAAVVRSGLERLGTMDRSTLEAFYFRGESLAEMSVSQSAPIGTIKRRLHVARKRLARQLEASSAV